jgi:hypothetical protein
MARIAHDPAVSPRHATPAARAILAAERNELHAIGVAMQAQTHQELVERIDKIEQHYVNQAPFRKAGQWP